MTWDVAIVGGGASGALLAARLIRSAGVRLSVVILDARGPHGAGIAYRTPEPWHLLNVPAGRMSAFSEEPLHFVQWLRQRDPSVREADFVPRGLYGAYLGSLLTTPAPSGARLEARVAEAVELVTGGDHVGLRLASGDWLDARAVVLATGHEPSAPLRVPDGGLYRTFRNLDSPFEGALGGIQPKEPVLLLGTGLTAVDAALSLASRGHRATVHALSRHGLLPQGHLPEAGSTRPWSGSAPSGLRALVARVRQAVREAERDSGNWRDVVDGMRSRTVELWQGLSRTEQRRFVRHLRTYWDVHRHRMAPKVAEALHALHASGKLQLHAGRVLGFSAHEDGVTVRFQPRGGVSERSLEVAHVVNCMGPAPYLRQTRSPLLRQLLGDGKVRADTLGMGVDVGPEGQLRDAAGELQPRLFALGPLLRGLRWESTAVPEIRSQAEDLARILLRLQAVDRLLEPHECISP